MKNTLKITTLFAIAFSITLFSCAKEETTETDTESPTITINAPVNQESHTSGDMLHIDIDVADNDEIHEIDAYLITTHMGMSDTVWTNHAHPDADMHSITDHYTIGTVMHTDFSLQVEASDHSGNVSSSSTGFHVMQ